MKRILAFVLLATVLASPVSAGLVIKTSVSPCDVAGESVAGTTEDYLNVGRWGGSVWVANKFPATDSNAVCKIVVRLVYVGTPGSNALTACLFADDGTGKPNGTTGISCSSPVAESSLFTGTDEQDIAFSLSTPAPKSSGTVYHVVVKRSALDSDNYPKWAYIFSWVPANMSVYDGSSWAGDAGRHAKFTIFE